MTFKFHVLKSLYRLGVDINHNNINKNRQMVLCQDNAVTIEVKYYNCLLKEVFIDNSIKKNWSHRLGSTRYQTYFWPDWTALPDGFNKLYPLNSKDFCIVTRYGKQYKSIYLLILMMSKSISKP